MKLVDSVVVRLGRPRALGWVVGLGLVLMLPALGTGRVMDDLVHQQMLAADAPDYLKRGPLDLYSFFPGGADQRQGMIEGGYQPWFADPNLHVELWRPLTSLTLYLDHALGLSPALAHLHSLIWFGGLLVLVGWLYRRLLPMPEVAALAALLFAIDDAHGHPVGWIANRHAVIAMVFGVGALLAHVRWRKEGWGAGAVVAPACLAAALFASESALALTGYLFAYALFLDRGTPARRALTLVPCAAVSVGWLLAYGALGYGAHGSALYIDPMGEPLRYLGAVVERLPLLVQSQLTLLSADAAPFFPGPVYSLVAVGILAVIGLILWPWLRRDRLAAFWAVGMLVSGLPVCAAFVGDRQLFGLGIGGMGLVAQLIARASDADLGDFFMRRRVRVLGGFFIAFHLVLSPLLLPLRAFQPGMMQATHNAAYRSLDQLGELAGKQLVIVNGPDYFWTTFVIPARRELGLSLPSRSRTLTTGLGPSTVTRVSPRQLRLASEVGFMNTYLDRLFRHPDRPFAPGERVVMSDLTIEVVRVSAAGDPTELLCTFTGNVEAPDRLFAVFSPTGYVPFPLPAVGKSLAVDAIAVADLAGFRYPAPEPR